MDAQYSDGNYLGHNPTWHVEDSPWKAAQISKMIEKHHLHPKRVAEIGCGAGAILSELSSRYPHTLFTGYELSPQAFEFCKGRTSERCSFLQQDMFDASSQVRYDLVLCIDVVEHVNDNATFLSQLRGLPGQKIFHFPLELSVLTVIKASALVGNRRRVGHVHFFNRELVCQLLADTGYTILDSWYTPWALDFRSRSWKAALLNSARRAIDCISRDLASRIFGGYSLLVLAE